LEVVGRCNPKSPSEFAVKPLGWASLGQKNHNGRRCFGFKPGDNVMVDCGFDIYKIVPDGVSVSQSEETKSIASVRIHVERAIGNYMAQHT